MFGVLTELKHFKIVLKFFEFLSAFSIYSLSTLYDSTYTLSVKGYHRSVHRQK